MADGQKRVIVAQQVQKQQSAQSVREGMMQAACLVAYHYPQYKPEDAMKINIKMQKRLLKVARKVEAERMYNLTQIAAAPHTKKGQGVRSLLDFFRKAF